jgi:hypothetical protein
LFLGGLRLGEIPKPAVSATDTRHSDQCSPARTFTTAGGAFSS